jgi:hypothetical protein
MLVAESLIAWQQVTSFAQFTPAELLEVMVVVVPVPMPVPMFISSQLVTAAMSVSHAAVSWDPQVCCAAAEQDAAM